MLPTVYNLYVQDLKCSVDMIRQNPMREARIEVSICKNGYKHDIVEYYGRSNLIDARSALLCGDDETRDDGLPARDALQSFFRLPEIYAYSSTVLARRPNPLTTTHWNATIALFDIAFHSRTAIWQQRMLFAGFDDNIHAEFFTASEAGSLVRDHQTGDHFYEWRGSAGSNPMCRNPTYKKPHPTMR